MDRDSDDTKLYNVNKFTTRVDKFDAYKRHLQNHRNNVGADYQIPGELDTTILRPYENTYKINVYKRGSNWTNVNASKHVRSRRNTSRLYVDPHHLGDFISTLSKRGDSIILIMEYPEDLCTMPVHVVGFLHHLQQTIPVYLREHVSCVILGVSGGPDTNDFENFTYRTQPLYWENVFVWISNLCKAYGPVPCFPFNDTKWQTLLDAWMKKLSDFRSVRRQRRTPGF
jgi:hypothetical protein